jgi:hypothetical protein
LQASLRTAAAGWDESRAFHLLSNILRTPAWLRMAAAAAAVVLLVRAAPFIWNPRGPSSMVEGVALPIASLTPGAVWSVSLAELCDGGMRDQREVPEAIRNDVLRRYHMERVPPSEYELDYLITPELGGAADARNLWPQRYGSRMWNAHVKDQLERLLPRLVCSGEMELAEAQREIAGDWIAAYKKHFRTNTPVRGQAGWLEPGSSDSPEMNRITYPVWHATGAPAVQLIAFSASR